MANPATNRGRVIAAVYANLDATVLDALTDKWPASTQGIAGDNIDPNYPDSWVGWEVDQAAAMVADAVLAAESHPSRSDFMTLSAALRYTPNLSGVKLPSFKGKPGDVFVDPTGGGTIYRAAEERSMEAVEWRRANYATVAGLGDENYFITDSNYLHFSGDPTIAGGFSLSQAKVMLGNYDVTDIASLELFNVALLPLVEWLALATLYTQAGHRQAMADSYFRRFTVGLQRIDAGEYPQKADPAIKESA